MSASLRPWRGSLDSETWKQVPGAPGTAPTPLQLGLSEALSVPQPAHHPESRGGNCALRAAEAGWGAGLRKSPQTTIVIVIVRGPVGHLAT